MNINKDRNNYIYGSGRIARAFLAYIKVKFEDYKQWIKGFVVTSNIGRIKEIDGIPIYNFSDVLYANEDIYIYIAVRDKYACVIEHTLNENGVSAYERIVLKDVIRELERLWTTSNNQSQKFIESANIETIPEEEYVMFLALQLEQKAIDFEVNIVDHCNLNCQSCNHFSPIAKEKYISLIDLQKDLERMEQLFCGDIGNVMLLGGEPLLHPEISRIFEIARESLPEAHLQLYTNGLLLPKMGEDFWNSCNLYRVEILVTRYPIDYDYEQCFEIAKNNNIEISCNWESTDVIKTTYKLPIKLEMGNDRKQYRNYILCDHANRCVVLRDGRLYTCPFAAYVDIFNERFEKELPELNDNSISIYDIKSRNEILNFLKKPVPMCKYCDVDAYKWDIPWKTSERKIEEWIEKN